MMVVESISECMGRGSLHHVSLHFTSCVSSLVQKRDAVELLRTILINKQWPWMFDSNLQRIQCFGTSLVLYMCW